MNNLIWSDNFSRKIKKLLRQNPKLRSLIEQKLEEIAENPFNANLRTHKLKGELSDKWSCSIDYSNRIIFKFIDHPNSEEKEILLLTIGSHDQVY
ncbi:type II toxin-antitoxin system RelE/ParE family toxin [Geminocystis herdmanii]|uniref:type II toxin-antitoxin system RelE/ParE family toxin n=1 Tax=Geminocystis herdmanii TaxID=669359 RepID=UPI00034AF8CB|nr:type II toxin-antitoxin system mRNA interferase toxin, RelE/StbE family [Geminocystis herdmanii]